MTVAAADSQKQRDLTDYRVLKFPAKRTASTDSIAATSGIPQMPSAEIVGLVKAANATAAIKAVAEKEGSGEYVAIPMSSWKPVNVVVEQTTVVKVGEPT